MISVQNISITDTQYDPDFLREMKEIGVECPPLGTELSFRIVGKSNVPANVVANAIRAGMNDGVEVLCLDVDTNVDVSKSNITTNSPYFINEIFVANVLRMIPIKQVANRKFHIDVNNNSDKYILVTSADIKPSHPVTKTDQESNDQLFFDNYHIAILPPHTFLNIQNIITTPGYGFLNGIGHSYSMRIGYNENVPDKDYTITTTPTTVIHPKQIIIQTCWMYIKHFTSLKKVVTLAQKFEYTDDEFTVSMDDKMVIYECKNWRPVLGSLIEEFGTMIDSSPETWISKNIIHNTIITIEIKVRHTDVKKYMTHILDQLIEVFNSIMGEFTKL